MDKITLPPNGLPQEVTNIPFGQVIVLTNPELGITSKTIKTVECIHSIARKIGQKSHTINTIPVDAAGLWDCSICKVKTEKGVHILVSNWDSLLEMLCEFWCLDYDEVSKIPDIIPGWHRTHKGVTLGGESHPVRVSVKAAKKPEGGEKVDDYAVTLQCIRTYTKEGQLDKIEDVLEDSINHGLDISILELGAILERVKEKERKTYHLEIHPHKGEEDYDSAWEEKVHKYDCDFSLVDSAGISHPFKLDAQSTALYLTFILFSEKGKKLADLNTDEEFFQTYYFFCQRLKSINNRAKGKKTFKEYLKETLGKYVNDKRKVIKKVIKDKTNDDKIAQELFCIEGVPGEEFRVKGATDDNRATIREEFEMK